MCAKEAPNEVECEVRVIGSQRTLPFLPEHAKREGHQVRKLRHQFQHHPPVQRDTVDYSERAYPRRQPRGGTTARTPRRIPPSVSVSPDRTWRSEQTCEQRGNVAMETMRRGYVAG